MSYWNDEALVLSRINYSETSIILKIFTQGESNISASTRLGESGGVVVLPVVTLDADLEGSLVGADSASCGSSGDSWDCSETV